MQKNNWIDKEFKKITNEKGVQRFIDKIKNMEVIVINKDKNWLKNEVEKIWHSGHPRLGEVVEYEGLKNLIEQLEEPMKIPELPKFVAEKISDSRFSDMSEIELVNKIKSRYSFLEWFEKKYPDASNREMERYLLIAILFDYTVVEEELYYLKLKEDLAEQLLLTRHKYLNVAIGKGGQAYTFDDKMGYSSYFKTKLTKEEVEIWKNKLNELEFDIVEVTE